MWPHISAAASPSPCTSPSSYLLHDPPTYPPPCPSGSSSGSWRVPHPPTNSNSSSHPSIPKPLRQFRRESEGARNRGEYSPPGLLSTDQFRHAFKKLSVRVSEAQVCPAHGAPPPMCACVSHVERVGEAGAGPHLVHHVHAYVSMCTM